MNLDTLTALSIGEVAKRLLERRETARNSLLGFTHFTFPAYQTTWYHQAYGKILEQFVKGNIRHLAITMPPQHGKSELSTRRLPAYMLGKNNKLRFGLSSYNATKAREFSQDVQRIIDDPLYHQIFPDSIMPSSKMARELGLVLEGTRTQEKFDVFSGNEFKRGDLRAVGRGGALTGNPLDAMVLDDLYKDYKEGNSSTIRKNVIDWYTSVVRTRFHNDSQELVVFTRWHADDLIGYLEKEETFEPLVSWKQLENPNPDIWYKINFEALMTEPGKSEFDSREYEEPLWADKHDFNKLDKFRKLDAEKFESLYQGNPRPLVGLLYREFNTYTKRPNPRYIRNYTDTADTGTDFLCSIDYEVGVDDNIYIVDITYTQEPHEKTEQMVADMMARDRVRDAVIESNNGGRGFARAVDRLSGYRHNIEWFFQGENKESRVVTNASTVQRKVYFPLNWEGRWPLFYKHITGFKKNFHSNDHDDAPDALTGVLEHSGLMLDNEVLWR